MRQPVQATQNGRPSLVLGLGCERGAPVEEVIALAEEAIRASGHDREALALVVSLDTRADEPAMRAAASHFSVPFRTFDVATLEAETPRLANPSEIVFRRTGCHGVAEASALAAAGPSGRLLVEKRKSAQATAAVAEYMQVLTDSSSEIGYGDPVHSLAEGAA